MSIVSLKRYLTGEATKPAGLGDALSRFVQSVLHGLELNAVEGDKAEYRAFREQLHSLATRVAASNDPAELLILAGGLNNCIETYHRFLNRFIRVQGREYCTIVSMLTRLVGDLAGATGGSVARLHKIEGDLERAAGSDDIRVARAQLSECVEAIRSERAIRIEEAAAIKRNLELAVEESAARLRDIPGTAEFDSCTGLGARRAAETAIADCIASARHVYAILFVLDRLQSINLRYGYAVGDQMLVRMCTDLESQLGAATPKFRWGGPALLFLLDRPDSFPVVQSAMKRIVSRRTEETIEIDQRSIFLTVTYSSAIVPLFQGIPAREISLKLDQLAAASQAQAPGS